MQFVLVIVTNLNIASVNLLCTLFNLLCTLYCICMLRYLVCLFLVYPFRKKGGQLYIKVIKNKCIENSSFQLLIMCITIKGPHVFLSFVQLNSRL